MAQGWPKSETEVRQKPRRDVANKAVRLYRDARIGFDLAHDRLTWAGFAADYAKRLLDTVRAIRDERRRQANERRKDLRGRK